MSLVQPTQPPAVLVAIDIAKQRQDVHAGQDGGYSSAARVSYEERVLAVEHNALHLALGYVVVDGHRTIGRGDGGGITLQPACMDENGAGAAAPGF